MATTSKPSNQSELQLYRVLERANLLQYYDVFIAQGGDDVQQLCEAGEEEFLEIMALVGMASKPLHVRRLQKALQEWVANPAVFLQPAGTGASKPVLTSMLATPQKSIPTQPPQPAHPQQHSSPYPQNLVRGTPPNVVNNNSNSSWYSPLPGHSPTHSVHSSQGGNDSPTQMSDSKDTDRRSSSSPVPTPVLVPSQIQSIADSAEKVAKTLPLDLEPKPLNQKKLINKEIEELITTPSDAQEYLELMRKYGAIYGRYDSKRKGEKPMSLHEISVNEASAQLCFRRPALLTRREELFPLARQVVRESGYQYSKGHSRAQNAAEESNGNGNGNGNGKPPTKKMKLDFKGDPLFQRHQEANPRTVQAELDKIKREERMTEINQALAEVANQQETIKAKIQEAKEDQDFPKIHALQTDLEAQTTQQLQLMTEQSEIIRKQKRWEKYQKQKAKDGKDFPGSGDDYYSQVSGSNGSLGGVYNIPQPGAPGSAGDTKHLVDKTLLDEGLRIAHQYGLGDFAEELQGMAKQEPEGEEEVREGVDDKALLLEEEEIDEQEEWNREIEQDALKLMKEATPPNGEVKGGIKPLIIQPNGSV